MFPSYEDIQIPFLREIVRRGGKTRPSDKNENGQTMYNALADHFGLSKEDREMTIFENGKARFKWHNMVRWVRNDCKKNGYLVSPSQHGIWEISAMGRRKCQ
ncbi:MAG: winged helix-turn-helix domain-containing protein [Deltaproteobacteria bacterium]|nr:winged helix-turn-helix domain-containing protein [Deltaproteobacteria bacterium]